jgi:WD40 repeat protein
LAAGGEDGSVRLWDLVKGTDRAVLHTKHRTARLVFIPDSQTIAVYGAESTLTLWDVTNEPPQVRMVLSGHTQPVRAAAVSPDGKLLASASADATIRLWDLTQSSAPECGRLDQHTDHILSLAFSPDAKRLAALGSQGQIQLWEVNGRLARGRLTSAPHGEASTLAYYPDGKSLVAAGNSNLRSFDVSGTEPRQLWDQKFAWVMSLAMAPDGQAVAGTVGNGRLILFDPASGVHRRVWHLPVKTHSIDFAPDGRHLAIACPGDAVVILRLAAGPK